MRKNTDFTDVTEFPGEMVTQQQINRFIQRYFWAAEYCKGNTVLEIACGAGPGLPLISSYANLVYALDIDKRLLSVARKHNPNVIFVNADIDSYEFGKSIFDVIMIHEAIYYFKNLIDLLGKLKQALRTGGSILISSVNPCTPGFNKSQFSTNYFDIDSYINIANRLDMDITIYGGFELALLSKNLSNRFRQNLKALAVSCGLIPKSMRGKRILKRIFFGGLKKMPVLDSVGDYINLYQAPQKIRKNNELEYEILYIKLTLRS